MENSKVFMNYFIVVLLLIGWNLKNCSPLKAEVNPILVQQIESNGNPKAFNRSSGARGLFQITPICLKHYNSVHRSSYSVQDLWRADVNTQVGTWYLRWLASKTKNDDEVLIAYNGGIGNLRKWNGSFQSLPLETRKYLTKYHKLEKK